MKLDLIQQLLAYHVAMTRRVWTSIAQISDEDFLAEDDYSRGSIRNLMVHLASTDRRWLAGLRDLPEVGHLEFEDFPTRVAALRVFESAAQDLDDYVSRLTEADLNEPAKGMQDPRWAILLHLVNHGTDHRATVLQKLDEFGAPTFDQDFIFWLWRRE